MSELITVSKAAKELDISSSHAYKLLKEIEFSPKYVSTTDGGGKKRCCLYDREELVGFLKNNIGENKIKGIYKETENTVFFNKKVSPLTILNETLKMNVYFKKLLFIKDKY